MALPSTVNRVPAHTAEHVNQQIRRRTERSVAYYRQHPQQIGRRLRELDREWDIERTLEANAATLVVAGAVLGLTVDRKFLGIPLVVGGFLLQHGDDPQLRNRRGHTPLAGAAFKGDLAMVKLLLEHGADVESRCEDGKTALMMAAMFNRVAIVEYLATQGADPRASDSNGATALAAARMMGAADTEALLQRLGA